MDSLPTYGQICRAASEPQQQGEEPVCYSSMTNEMNLTSLFSASTSPPCSKARAIFVGEQHHQPKVLAAQLQIIYQLFEACKEPNRIHVVFEQWSLLDQPYLNRINRQEADLLDLRANSEERTSEGFDVNHYLPLVKLVRELGGTVWAGFPPRSWASLISKAEDGSAFEKVQQFDKERYTAHKVDSVDGKDIVPPLSVSDYRYVENISWPHRSYLKSMFRPDERPQSVAESQHTDPPKEDRGFLAAQAVKDTFLAHTMTSILAEDPLNIVVAVAGLGHCEWGFGAPERVKEMSGVDSYLIMTKADDAGYWTAAPASASEKPANISSDRRQADAIILYNWVD
ncbi:hypothetical protein CBS101457_006720 [Exobasidium rhododendri]|nr:hypothetical protein CBS101457_006720 [Exobasidium rhododendri]